MDKFEEKETKKRKFQKKNTWYDCLINYISEPIKKWWVVLRKRL